MLLYLLLFVGLFGFIVFKLMADKRHKEKPMLFAAMVYTFVCSVIGLCIYVFIPNRDQYLLFIIGAMIGGMFILIAINNLASVFQCRAEVKGKYCGYRTYYGGKGQSSHAPVFTYTYNGRTYHEQSTQNASLQLLDKEMVQGEMYTIYVNERHPNVFVLKKKVRFSDVMLLFFGVLCLLVAFWSLLSV